MLVTVFMIRDGDFGSDYNFKLIGALIGALLALYYWVRHKKLDYVWVYAIGFLVWFGVEWFLQLMGIRDIKDAYLFGSPISSFVQALLRGGFEGALIAVMGIFFADGLMSKGKERWAFGVAFLIVLTGIATQSLMQALPLKDAGGEVLSRRDMLNPIGLFLLFGALAITLWWAKTKATPLARKRALYMYLVMVSIALVWNIAEFTANTRWIETGTFANPERATPAIEFIAISFDTFIEIGMAYMPFLVFAYLFRLIR
jgi:cobalamin synthase